MSQNIFFTPGPSQLYFTVSDHLKNALKEDVPSISHRGKAFEKIFAEARENLTQLLQIPDGYDMYFISSANEIWERIIQNLVRSSSCHFVNGDFAKKFFDFTRDYQKQSGINLQPDGGTFEDLTVPAGSELISITLNETSCGFAFEPERVYQLRNNHPDKLIAVDGVSAFPCVSFDFSKIDTAYFSVQKAFGLPAGLGVWIVNERCYEKADSLSKEGVVTGSYHALSALRKNGVKNQTPETPNVLGIYLLAKVAGDLLFRSARTIQNETAYKSAILYQAIEESNSLSPFIQSKQNRSKTVVVAECNEGNTRLLEEAASRDWIIGKGYGNFKTSHIRIANFPAHSKELMEQLADFLVKQ